MSLSVKRPLSNGETPAAKRLPDVIDLTDDALSPSPAQAKLQRSFVDTSGLSRAQRDVRKELWACFWSYKATLVSDTGRAHTVLGQRNLQEILKRKLDALEMHRAHVFSRKFSYTAQDFATDDSQWIISYVRDKMGEVKDATPRREDSIVQLIAANMPSCIKEFELWYRAGVFSSIFLLIDKSMDDATLKNCLATGTPEHFREFVKTTVEGDLAKQSNVRNQPDVLLVNKFEPIDSLTPDRVALSLTKASLDTPAKSEIQLAITTGTPQMATASGAAAQASSLSLSAHAVKAEEKVEQQIAVTNRKRIADLVHKDPASVATALQAMRYILSRYKAKVRPVASARHPLDLLHRDGTLKQSFNSFVLQLRDGDLNNYLQSSDVKLNTLFDVSKEARLADVLRYTDSRREMGRLERAVAGFKSSLRQAYNHALGRFRIVPNQASAQHVEETKLRDHQFSQLEARHFAPLAQGTSQQFVAASAAQQLTLARTLWPNGWPVRPTPPISMPMGPAIELPALLRGLDTKLPIGSYRPRGTPLGPDETPEDFRNFLNELEQDDFVGDTDEGVRAAAERLGLEATPGHKFRLEGLRSCDLLQHQVIGVDFMVHRESKTDMLHGVEKQNRVRGGLLADAMGLGKTVQCIATMVKNHPKLNDAIKEETSRTSTLIVCPVALIHQWKREIESKAPGLFKVGVYHGITRMRTIKEIKMYDVVLTSYGTMGREYPVKKWGKRPTNDELREDQERIERKKGNLFRVSWLRLILDEAHTIKNPAANVSIAAANLGAQRNWCLTGTPLQNKLEDIFAIFRVLRVPNVSQRPSFRAKFPSSRQGAQRLRAALAPFLMRRTENDKIAGRPILNLPTKHVHMPALTFSEDELSLYKEVENSMRTVINRALVEGTAIKEINHFLIMLLRLRQLCIHPFLILEHLSARQDFDEDDFLDAAYHTQAQPNQTNTMAAQVARGLAFDGVDESGVMCGICHMDAQDPLFAEGCHHVFCLQCVEDTETIVDEQSSCPACSETLGKLVEYDDEKHNAATAIEDDKALANEKAPLRVSATLANGTQNQASATSATPGKPGKPLKPIKPVNDGLEASDTESEDDMPARSISKKRLVPVLDIDSDLSDAEMADLAQLVRDARPSTSTADPNGQQDVKPQSTLPDSATPVAPSKVSRPDAKLDVKTPLLDNGPASRTPNQNAALRTNSTNVRRPVIPGMDDNIGLPPVNPRSLAKAVLPDPGDCEPKEDIYPVQTKEERKREARSWEEILKLELLPSTKVNAVEAQLKTYMQENDDKIIIFSQFVKAIDLLNKVCSAREWPCLRYQGSMSVRQRESTLRDFEDPDGPRILLMSLKAGGVGLNLVCANKVILVDFWWNAAIEHQAIARCHRLGQNKDVTVHRFFIPGTVEERIITLQEAKLKTAGTVLGETEGGGRVPRLSLRDIMGLFGTLERNEDGIMQIM